MRSLMGLLWALGGAVIGLIIGVVVSVTFSTVTHASNREGAQGYLMVAVGILGAVIGLVVGLLLYARSAPSGQAFAFIGSGTFGVLGLIALIAAGLYAFMNLREAPLEYGGAMATFEMEFRISTASLPTDTSSRWLNIEVQTANSRPEGTVLWDKRRVEGNYTVIPVVQGPMWRSGSRFIVVRMTELHDEMFNPPIPRTPNPKADWSEWYKPNSVDPPYGVVPAAPLKPLLEFRYRVRPYGSDE